MTYGDDVVTSFYKKCEELETARADNRPSALAWQQRIFSAAALQTMTFPPLKFILPGLVPEGATLLVSRPKFGKSWLALDVAIATAADRFTLGTLKPAAGDVLYLALEDGKRRLQRRVTKVLPSFSITWPKNLEIATEWPRADQGGLADIEQWLQGHPNARLVIVDTLAQFRKLSTGKGQLYPEDYAAISGLQKLASKYNVGIIIIHHDRKSEADDVFDTVSGTLGLTGAADTILIMKRQAGAVTLYVRGRDIEESEMAMQFDKASCRWSILGTAADVHRSNERTAVLKALETADADGLSVAEIMTATGSQHRNAMDKLLFRMVADGEVERMRRRGLYRLPQDKPGHPDPSSTGKISQKVRSEQKPSYFQKDGLSTNTADLTGKIDSQIERDAEALISRENPARSDFLTDLTAPGAFRPPEPTVDPWEHPDLAGGVPDYLLVRNRPRLGPPAISAGPDDDLGDLK